MEFLIHLQAYLLLVLVTVAVGAVAIFLGITLRKKKDAKEAANEQV